MACAFSGAETQGNVKKMSQTLQHFQKAYFYYATILTGYLLISAFYIFPSGYPQPADMVMFLAVAPGAAMLFLHNHRHIKMPYLLGAFFVGLTVIINLMHYMIAAPDIRFILSSAIYLYNFLVFLVVSHLYRHFGDRLFKPTTLALAAIIGIEVLWLLTFPEESWRKTGTLNNPNQLAYWSLLTMMMLVVIKTNRRFSLLDYGLIAALIYIQSLALSKAGIITFGLTMVILPFIPQVSKAVRFLLIGAMLCCLTYQAFNIEALTRTYEHLTTLQAMADRVMGIGEERDDSFSARGYGRLLAFPQYTILGAGEGYFERFDPLEPIELHSGLATIFFSYGVLGGCVFLAFLGSIIIRQPWYYIVLFGFVLLFGIPHQNFRFTHFWFYLGMLDGMRAFYMARRVKGSGTAQQSLPADQPQTCHIPQNQQKCG